MAPKKQKRQPKGDYRVGYCRPPAQHRFQPGKSGNPTGQRKGSAIKTTADELKEIVATTVKIRNGESTRKVSLITANLLTHGMNGAKGDARSAALFLNQAQKLGLLDSEVSVDLTTGPPSRLRPSDVLLESIDPSLLSRDEQIELSQLAAIINRDGNIWTLSASEFERVRELVNKGRAKDASLALSHQSLGSERSGSWT
jgi:hypothetical protein